MTAAPDPSCLPAAAPDAGGYSHHCPPASLSIAYPWPDYRLSPNGRANRRLRARLVKQVRETAARITADHGLGPGRQGVPVAVDYRPPSARWDKDNCRAMSKAILDGIADAMGVNDKTFDPSPRVMDPIKGGEIVVTFEIPDE